MASPAGGPGAQRRGVRLLLAGIVLASLLPIVLTFAFDLGFARAGVVLVVCVAAPGGACLLLPARHERRLRRLLVVVAAVALGLDGVDLGLRLLVSDQILYRPHERFLEQWPGLPHVHRYTPNVSWEGECYGELAAQLGPNAPRETRTVRFRTDARGFRNDGLPAGPLDLLLLGDSFGVGNGTTREDTLAARLPRLTGLELYNLSMIGSPWHELCNLRAELPRLELRPGAVLVWMLFGANDLDEQYHDLAPPPPQSSLAREWSVVQDRISVFGRRSPLRNMILRVGRPVGVCERELPDGRAFLFFESYAERAGRDRAAIQAHRNCGRLLEAMGAVIDLARSRGLRVLVVSIPPKCVVYRWVLDGEPPGERAPPPSGWVQVVAERCRELDAPFLDLAPGMVAAAREAWRREEAVLYWTDDTHWNGRGHRVAAELVAEALPRAK